MNNHKQEEERMNAQGALDRLGMMIPLVDFKTIDVTSPALFRVAIDSETAAEMLSLNVRNRRQRRNAVDYLKKQIRMGEWRDDHPQPVVFSSEGRLIDGQHRLQAIAESKIGPDRAIVIRCETGARDDVREYLDTGVPRSLDDRVEFVSDHLLNKAIGRLITYNFTRSGTGRKPSPEDAREFFSAHKEAILFVASNWKKDAGVGRVQVGYAAMEYFELSPERAEEFYPSIFLIDGPVQQARVLRDWLLRSLKTRIAQKDSSALRHEVYHRSVGCMKAHMEGREIKIVRQAAW